MKRRMLGLFLPVPLIGVALDRVTVLLRQVADALPATAPATQVSPWSPAMITALFGGIVGVIGAVTALIIAVSSLRKEGRESRAALKAQVEQVHTLVNSTNSALIEKVARLTERIAQISGRRDDKSEAEAAQRDVDDKAIITNAAAAMKQGQANK